MLTIAIEAAGDALGPEGFSFDASCDEDVRRAFQEIDGQRDGGGRTSLELPPQHAAA